jgi:hypothetical protein
VHERDTGPGFSRQQCIRRQLGKAALFAQPVLGFFALAVQMYPDRPFEGRVLFQVFPAQVPATALAVEHKRAKQSVLFAHFYLHRFFAVTGGVRPPRH